MNEFLLNLKIICNSNNNNNNTKLNLPPNFIKYTAEKTFSYNYCITIKSNRLLAKIITQIFIWKNWTVLVRKESSRFLPIFMLYKYIKIVENFTPSLMVTLSLS